MQRKKILIAQGGGPTMVINESLVGIIKEAKKKSYQVFGSENGVNGIINSKFYNLSSFSDEKLKLISKSPGAALGSTRDKPDEKYCNEILKIIQLRKFEKFFYIGGNDSSDSLKIISEKSDKLNYELQCIHVPKTIDNDLVLNDHTPGFGSAAKYVASVFAGINLDINSLPGVYIGITMGRHAGFLTASSTLLKQNKNDGPHLIYLPETTFNISKFLKDVKLIYHKYGKCIIAVSEGIKDKDNILLSQKILDSNEKDAHGNIQLSGSGALGDFLSNEIKSKLNIKRVRSDTLGYTQRSFIGCRSEVDEYESKLIGKKAFTMSLKEKNSFSVAIKERENFNLAYQTNIIKRELKDIAGKTKLMPNNFINNDCNNITKSFINYAKPLIGKKITKFITKI